MMTVTDWIVAVVAVLALILSVYNTIYNTFGKRWGGVTFIGPGDWRFAYLECSYKKGFPKFELEA